ncbi:hypothetical protein WN943_022221 [Citrus x changshan-huyou]
MGSRELTMVLILWGSCCLFAGGNGVLVLHFYKKSCPSAEMPVKEEMKRNMLSDISSAAAILRLDFHDCQVDGCDGSILLGNSNGITTETLSDKNFGIRKVDIINEIKSSLETICPETVSCADFIQLAARDAVYLRIHWVFLQKNISLEDGVALMGSHTLGVSHCRNFQNRLWPIKDDTLSLAFSGMLEMICSNPTLSDISFAQNDATTLYVDNQYFIDIQSGRGLLKIDSEIATDPRTQPYVTAFGQNTQHFFDRFSSGFLKLSNYKVLVGGKGEIRRDCRFINS